MNPEQAEKLDREVRLSIGNLHIQIVSLQIALSDARAELAKLKEAPPAEKPAG